MNDGAKQASLDCNRATFTLQYSLCCLTKEPLFHTNSGCIGEEKRLFLYIMGSKAMLNHTKKAIEISKTDFYFVIGFYHLYDICMRHEGMFFRHEDMFFRLPAMPT
mgnify:CR=1 FL=1